MGAIEDVKSRLDIVELVGSYVPLKKAGRNMKGLCPFHQEKTPSFIVFPDSQNYHCFGCGAGGDIYTFLMQMENLTFSEALRQLARQAGVVLRPPTPEEKEADQERRHLRELNLAAARFFRNQLLFADEGAVARSYLDRRKVEEETSEIYLLGYAPDRWEGLRNYLLERGYDEATLLQAGLVSERDSGGTYDRFRNRLIFPIRDLQGHVVGFGGRVLDDEAQPKYLNSPQTPLFDKGEVLYGLDQAAGEIRRTGQVVLVEGYFDVLTGYQLGYKNLVAPMGTALTEKQVQLLKRLTQQLYLAMDADAAGVMATLRGVEVIREAMDERVVPVPTARGLVRFERELDGEIRIVPLPSGRDPDEVMREDPASWERLLAGALPVLEFVLQRTVEEADLDSARGKVEAIERLLPLLADIRDPVERGHYVQRLAQRLHVSERDVEIRLRQTSPSSRSARREADLPEIPLLAREEETVEGFLMALLFHFPYLRSALPPGVPALLSQEKHRVLLQRILAGDEVASTELSRYLEELADRFHGDLQLEDSQARQAMQASLARLEVLDNERQYRRCGYLLAQAEEEGDRELVREMLQRLSMLSQRRGTIPTPRPSRLFPDLRRHLDDGQGGPVFE